MRNTCTFIGMVLALVWAVSGCDKGKETPAPDKPAEKAEAVKPDEAKKPAEAKPAEDKPAEAKPDAVVDAAKDALAKTKAGEQVKDLAAKGDQLKGTLEDKAPPLTAERYEELILALAPCELKERSIDSKCEQYQALQKAKQNKNSLLKDLAGVHSKLGRKHLAHESAAVRLYATGLMGSAFANGVAKEDVQAIVAAGKKEKDPIVLTNMLRTIGSSHGKDPSAGKFLVAMTRHENEMVRMEALGNLATWGKKTKGVVPAFKKAILKDKSVKVRAYACENAGRLGNDKLLPVMQKLAMKKKTDPDVYAGCFKGVINLWTGYPFPPEKPSAKAYKATLKLLQAKPRNEKRPPWTLSGSFSGLKDPKEEWVKKARFYKKPKFFKAVSTVVVDKKTNWMARTGFIKLLVELEAPKSLFAKMRKAYKKDEGSDSHVIKALDEAIEKMK